MNTALRTTTNLHDVRRFLADQSAGTAPWTPSGATVDALLTLLRERRHDEAFWVELRGLLERLEDSRVRPELIQGAEVLGGAAVGKLLATLRDALPENDAPAGSWIRGASAAHVLAALLLLGTAGCAPMLGAGGAPGVDGECSQAQELALDEEDTDVYCELVDLVEDADVSTSVRADVLDCLPSLSATYREYLVNQFRTYSDVELADALQDLAWSDECDDEWDDDDAADH